MILHVGRTDGPTFFTAHLASISLSTNDVYSRGGRVIILRTILTKNQIKTEKGALHDAYLGFNSNKIYRISSGNTTREFQMSGDKTPPAVFVVTPPYQFIRVLI